ncbi:MAG: hypothetical protein HS132_12195 [Planctomycetia bacterium]|nr:hypothetical protein [Planctomycetia bacterium]
MVKTNDGNDSRSIEYSVQNFRLAEKDRDDKERHKNIYNNLVFERYLSTARSQTGVWERAVGTFYVMERG